MRPEAEGFSQPGELSDKGVDEVGLKLLSDSACKRRVGQLTRPRESDLYDQRHLASLGRVRHVVFRVGAIGGSSSRAPQELRARVHLRPSLTTPRASTRGARS